MTIANGVNIVGYSRNNTEFKLLISGFGNSLNFCLVIVCCFVLTTFGIYHHVRIHSNHHLFEKDKKVKEKYENFLEQLHCRDKYSSVFNILFLYRRFLTALILVFGSDYPYF